MDKPQYGISARDYLQRAREQLDRELPHALFYAAFELRGGIEQRMREYLKVQEHVVEKEKEGWRIPNLGRTIENAFGIGDKIARFAVMERASRDMIGVFYYTPVSSTLQSMAGHLGNYTHSQLSFQPPDDSWWDDTRSFLEQVYAELFLACRGTLLGPPLISPGGKLRMPVEFDEEAIQIANTGIGRKFTIEVSYLDEYPEALKQTT